MRGYSTDGSTAVGGVSNSSERRTKFRQNSTGSSDVRLVSTPRCLIFLESLTGNASPLSALRLNPPPFVP